MHLIELEGLSYAETTAVLCAAFACLGCLLTLLAQTIWQSHLKSGRVEAVAPGTTEDLPILWSAMNSHAMVNISDADGRLIYVNEAFVRTTGYTEDELLGREIKDFLLSPDTSNAVEVKQRLAGGQNWTSETKLLRKNGSPVWTSTTIVPLTDASGKVVRTVSLRTDITAHKERQAERESRNLLGCLRDEVYVIAIHDLRLEYLNRRALRFLGWSEGDVAGKSVADIAPDFEEVKFRERAAPLLSGEKEVLTYESMHHGRPVEVNLQVVERLDGTKRFVATVRDITRRKEIEAENAAFIANVSHELRSPLTSVLGALKLGTAGSLGPLPSKAQGVFGIALRNVERLVAMVNDLLDLEKIASGRLEMPMTPTDLSVIVKEAVAANINYAAELGVTLRAIGTERPHVVNANPDRMIQVLNNLLSNASKFSKPGQVVLVELCDATDSVQIYVRDRGVGIPADMQSKMFERFAQADSGEKGRPKGTGLGLSIAKAIIEDHGGTIDLTSKEGVGTTFCIELPLQHEAQDAA